MYLLCIFQYVTSNDDVNDFNVYYHHLKDPAVKMDVINGVTKCERNARSILRRFKIDLSLLELNVEENVGDENATDSQSYQSEVGLTLINMPVAIDPEDQGPLMDFVKGFIDGFSM